MRWWNYNPSSTKEQAQLPNLESCEAHCLIRGPVTHLTCQKMVADAMIFGEIWRFWSFNNFHASCPYNRCTTGLDTPTHAGQTLWPLGAVVGWWRVEAVVLEEASVSCLPNAKVLARTVCLCLLLIQYLNWKGKGRIPSPSGLMHSETCCDGICSLLGHSVGGFTQMFPEENVWLQLTFQRILTINALQVHHKFKFM